MNQIRKCDNNNKSVKPRIRLGASKKQNNPSLKATEKTTGQSPTFPQLYLSQAFVSPTFST